MGRDLILVLIRFLKVKKVEILYLLAFLVMSSVAFTLEAIYD